MCVVFIKLLLTVMATSASSSSPMNILVFGGNGFIGSHVSEHLLDAGHRLTLVSSRGSFEFDTAKTVGSRIDRHFRCDRYNPTHCDEELWHQLDQGARNFDAVIDYSAYRLNVVRPFYERLAAAVDDGPRPLYIYIGTDTVYEVCERPKEERLLKETDSVRPADANERLELAKGDSYGHKKLEIEEYLIDQRQNYSGLPYIILRLPDVLGERDSTQRWWKYQLWLRYGKSVNRQVQLPTFARSLATSFVDVKDVAAVVKLVLEHRPKCEDRIYNVGFPKPITLFDLLTEMKSHSNAPDGSIADSSCDGAVSYFPSVTRGGVDVSKLQTELGWRPLMDWQNAVKRISKFYLDAETRYGNEMLAAARKLMRDLQLDDEEQRQFWKALRARSPEMEGDVKKRKVKDEF